MIRKFFENPVGFMLGLIVLLVLAASFLPQIINVLMPFIIIGLIVLVGYAIYKIVTSLRHNGGGTYCTNCPHVNHGRAACSQCNCRHS